jgi:hypothetical protein
MIVTDEPGNMTPDGTQPHREDYQKISDSWGNTYISAGVHRMHDHRRWFYMPLAPVKKAGTPRRLSLTYVIEPRYGEVLTLTKETLDVPAPPAVAQAGWPKDFARQKQTWYRNYLQSDGTLEQQLAEVDRRLKIDPTDVDSLIWRYRLFRRYGRPEVGIKFFEEHLRDRALQDPAVLEACTSEMSQYLLYLAANNRMEEMKQASSRIRRTVEELSSSLAQRERWKHSSLLNKEHDPLYRTTHLLEWREAFKDGPSVVRTVASKDGFVFIELQIPEPPVGWQSSGWDGRAPTGWFWGAAAIGDAGMSQGHAVHLEKRRLGLVFRAVAPQLVIGGEAVLQQDNYEISIPKNDFKAKWQRTIDVPAATVDAMPSWFAGEMGGAAQWHPSARPSSQPVAVVMPNAVQRLLEEADKLRTERHFVEALKRYEQVMSAPAEQWPEHLRAGYSLDTDPVAGRKRKVRIARAECLAHLGRFDEARAEAAAIRAVLPAAVDLTDPVQGLITGDALAADVNVAKGLLSRGEAKAALAEMTRIAQHRSTLQDIPNTFVMVPRGPAKIGWNARGYQVGRWREFDSAWWDIRDAAVAGPAK